LLDAVVGEGFFPVEIRDTNNFLKQIAILIDWSGSSKTMMKLQSLLQLTNQLMNAIEPRFQRLDSFGLAMRALMIRRESNLERRLLIFQSACKRRVKERPTSDIIPFIFDYTLSQQCLNDLPFLLPKEVSLKRIWLFWII
jgi:hypothetical protein